MTSLDTKLSPSISDSNNPYGLTQREQEVVATMMHRRTDVEACIALRISYGTFLTYRRGLMRKFGARNELHLAHLICTMHPPVQEDDFIVLEDIPSAWGY